MGVDSSRPRWEGGKGGKGKRGKGKGGGDECTRLASCQTFGFWLVGLGWVWLGCLVAALIIILVGWLAWFWFGCGLLLLLLLLIGQDAAQFEHLWKLRESIPLALVKRGRYFPREGGREGGRERARAGSRGQVNRER
jgi:hypothetical protein